jgi:hypothetical protein
MGIHIIGVADFVGNRYSEILDYHNVEAANVAAPPEQDQQYAQDPQYIAQ